jgi:hypothetical protein
VARKRKRVASGSASSLDSYLKEMQNMADRVDSEDKLCVGRIGDPLQDLGDSLWLSLVR